MASCGLIDLDLLADVRDWRTHGLQARTEVVELEENWFHGGALPS